MRFVCMCGGGEKGGSRGGGCVCVCVRYGVTLGNPSKLINVCGFIYTCYCVYLSMRHVTNAYCTYIYINELCVYTTVACVLVHAWLMDICMCAYSSYVCATIHYMYVHIWMRRVCICSYTCVCSVSTWYHRGHVCVYIFICACIYTCINVCICAHTHE